MRKPFKKKTWIFWTGFYGGIDVIQDAIDLGFTEFAGIPEGINEIADIIIGTSQALLFWYGKAISLKSALVLALTFLTEEATGGGAPFWFLDVIYAQKNAPPHPEEAATAIYVVDGPPNQNGVRRSDNAAQKPLNIKQNGVGVRPPGSL